MAVRTPIETRSGLPAWALGLTVFLFLVGGVYAATNLSGENPPAQIPGASIGPGAGPSGAPDPAVGQALTAEAGCQACHGQNWEGGVGPTLVGVAAGPQSENLQDLAAERPDDWMQLWIAGNAPEVAEIDRQGMPVFAGPPYNLDPIEIEAIVAYLKTL
jgi:mono/diheme cytochrome c family protein